MRPLWTQLLAAAARALSCQPGCRVVCKLLGATSLRALVHAPASSHDVFENGYHRNSGSKAVAASGVASRRATIDAGGWKMKYFQALANFVGGDGGIRTLDTLLGYAHLANECLQPLGHVSVAGLAGAGVYGRGRGLLQGQRAGCPGLPGWLVPRWRAQALTMWGAAIPSRAQTLRVSTISGAWAAMAA